MAGWSDQQFVDGTVVVTTPTGHNYTTRPGISLLFPEWTASNPAPTASGPRALNDDYVAERNAPPPF